MANWWRSRWRWWRIKRGVLNRAEATSLTHVCIACCSQLEWRTCGKQATSPNIICILYYAHIGRGPGRLACMQAAWLAIVSRTAKKTSGTERQSPSTARIGADLSGYGTTYPGTICLMPAHTKEVITFLALLPWQRTDMRIRVRGPDAYSLYDLLLPPNSTYRQIRGYPCHKTR